jgi:hypothetical protein
MATRPLIVAALSLALVPLGSAFAQVTPPPPPGVAPSPPGAVAASVVTGRIKTLLMNPNGDIDGLLLTDDTQINFPPHLTEALLQIARIGDAVSVQGFRGYGAGALHATVITNTSSGKSMMDQPPAPNRPPPALTAITANGRVSQLLHADMGAVNGARLDDGTIVRFPPPFGVQLQNVLQPNVQLTATGYGTQNGYGRALEATTLAINGQAAISVYGLGAGPGPGTVGLPPTPGVAPQSR